MSVATSWERGPGTMKTANFAEGDASTTKRSLSIEQVTYFNIIRALAAELAVVGHGFLYFRHDINTYINLGSLGVVIFF